MRLVVEIVNPSNGEHRMATVEDAPPDVFVWTAFLVQALTGVEKPDPDMVEPVG